MNTRNYRLAVMSGVLLVSMGLLSGCVKSLIELIPKEESHGLYDGNAKVLYEAKESATTGREAMEYAERALQVGDTDRALYQFVRAYELDPSQYEALYNVGRIQAGKQNLDRAALAFNMALEVAPNHTETLVELGLVELRLRRYDQASEHIKLAISNGSTSWRAFNGLAVLADLNRDFESADQYYVKALNLHPDSPVIWNNRGYSKYLSGDWTGAQRYIKKALDNDSGYQKAWLNLGLIYVRQGSYEKALSAFERVMDRASSYERVGSLALIEGKYDTAEHFLYRAIDESPSYFEDAYEKVRTLNTLRGEEGHS